MITCVNLSVSYFNIVLLATAKELNDASLSLATLIKFGNTLVHELGIVRHELTDLIHSCCPGKLCSQCLEIMSDIDNIKSAMPFHLVSAVEISR